MAKLFKGCGTALVTPFRTDGSVDFEAYAALVDRQVAAGVDFLVPLATTGETPTLSPEEKVRLLDITREHAASLPLLVGAGSNSVPGTIANMQLLEGHGADAWLIVVPFYNKPNQEGQYRYFCEIARHSALPIVIYNVPGRTGTNMTAATCIRIASDCPNVVAVKEASGKMDQVVEILQGARAAGLSERIAVLSGDDDMTLEMMKNGADGVISVASNIAPDRVAAMVREASDAYLATSGDCGCGSRRESAWDAADALDAPLQPLYRACFVEPNPIPAKSALSLLGLCTDAMRLPLVPATDQTRELMRSVLAGLCGRKG